MTGHALPVGYDALRHGAGRVDRNGAVLEVSGPDAAAFLHGQLSADVESLAVGAGTEALLLSPKGRLVAVGYLLRTGDTRFAYVVDARVRDATAERLVRFHLRVDCDIAGDDELGVWSVLGPAADAATAAALGAAAVPPHEPLAVVSVPSLGDDAVAVRAATGALAGIHLAAIAGEPDIPGAVSASRGALDAVRVEHGVALFGVDYDESTVPHDAGLVPRAVGLDKGCYVGQELIERIWSRGHANRTPRSVRIHAGEVPAPGAVVSAGDREVGRLTTTAWCPAWDAPGGLGLLRIDVGAGAEVSVEGAAATVVASG